MVALAENSIEVATETQDPVRSSDQARAERLARRGLPQETPVPAPKLPEVSREQAQAEAARPESDLFPTQDPTVTQEPIVIKPKNIEFGTAGRLVIDPSKDQASKDLYDSIQAALRAGAKIDYTVDLQNLKQGEISLTYKEREVRFPIHQESDWQQKLQDGINRLARTPAPDQPTEVRESRPQIDLSKLSYEQLSDLVIKLYPENSALNLQLFALTKLEREDLRANPSAGSAVDGWLNRFEPTLEPATQNFQRQFNQSIQFLLDQTIQFKEFERQTVLRANQLESQFKGDILRAVGEQNMFHLRLEALEGLTYLDSAMNTIQDIEVRGKIKDSVKKFASLDIPSWVERTISNMTPQAEASARVTGEIGDLNDRRVSHQAHMLREWNQFTSPEAFTSRLALQKYAAVLLKEREEISTDLTETKKSIGSRIGGDELKRVDRFLDKIDNSVARQDIIETERRSQFADLVHSRKDAIQNVSRAEAKIQALQLAGPQLTAEWNAMTQYAYQGVQLIEQARQRTISGRVLRGAQEGVNRGAERAGNEIGRKIEESIGRGIDKILRRW